MAVIDYVGAACARATGVAALVPAWILVDRYALGALTGGPLVLTTDTLRASLFPVLWVGLAWVLLNPRTTRHFCYRRESHLARVLLGFVYLLGIPAIFLTAIEMLQQYALEHAWLADMLTAVLPFAWIGFLVAFSVPGNYAWHMVLDREEEEAAALVRSNDSLTREADRAFTDTLREQGLAERNVQEDDPATERWRQNVVDRKAVQTELRQARRAGHKSRDRRRLGVRVLVGLGVVGVVLAVYANVSLSLQQERTLTRYMPVILGVVLVTAFIIGNIGWGVRGGTVFGRVFRIIGFVVIVSVLANFVFLPAGTNLLAIVYNDFLAEGMSSILRVTDPAE